MSRRAFGIALFVLLLLGACAPPRSVESSNEEIEAMRQEISGITPTPAPTSTPAAPRMEPLELPTPTPSPSSPEDPGISVQDPALASPAAMTDQLAGLCVNRTPVESAAPYQWTTGIHPLWVVDAAAGATGGQPVWLPGEWSASDASSVQIVACTELYALDGPITCTATEVRGSFFSIELLVASTGQSLGTFFHVTAPSCADESTLVYAGLTPDGEQIVVDRTAITQWMQPIVDVA